MRVGTIGDRYRIARRLGTGGMSRVYLCWDERLHLWCAIKVMVGEVVNDAVLRARFIQEARTLARLGHPHLVRLYDLVDSVESPYMVMEYVEGGTVAARLARSEIPLHHAVRLAAEACSALHAAHEASVIHRDVKPQNLLLDAHGGLKVSDFGVARVGQEMRLTSSNMSLGTVAYMPPEQQRDASKVDHRADIYGVGATLYAMATSRRPTALLTSERHRAILMLPPEVRHIVERATAPSRKDRYDDAKSMEEALRFALKQIPLSPHAAPLVDQLEPPPDEPPEEGTSIELEPGELDGTERAWTGPSLAGRPAKTERASTPRPSPPRPTFREIDPSADSRPSRTMKLPDRSAGARSLVGRMLMGTLALGAGVLCGGGCAGMAGMGGLGAILAMGQ